MVMQSGNDCTLRLDMSEGQKWNFAIHYYQTEKGRGVTTLSACYIQPFMKHLYCWIQLDNYVGYSMSCGKSGHSSAILNINSTFKFLECTFYDYIIITNVVSIEREVSKPSKDTEWYDAENTNDYQSNLRFWIFEEFMIHNNTAPCYNLNWASKEASLLQSDTHLNLPYLVID